jgi:hypothetical protein
MEIEALNGVFGYIKRKTDKMKINSDKLFDGIEFLKSIQSV